MDRGEGRGAVDGVVMVWFNGFVHLWGVFGDVESGIC